ncbi:MAG: polyprenol monophosphomannose synthase [Caldilineaceae bacterium]|nr:polyprenol monophosphomannose synthase [Caldilineaceae bacterium]MCY4118374.1 polyprenol monophosphomannose synthase [Caldilineaceae bacterium]MDE0183496.1 polyprenol monophosphomannose synthase [Caldilineaceae bacterium]
MTVVVPTYNEASNLEELVEALFALPLAGLRLVIVDDNSPDGTGPLADNLARRYSDSQRRITVIHRKHKAGLGTAYIEGFRRALADGAEFIVQMDADFSHSPAYIIPMLGTIDAAGMDVVVGSRYAPGGTLDEDWSSWRRLLSWWANLYCRAILRIRVRDMTSGFKLWRRTALQELRLETVRSSGYVFTVELAYLSEKLGFRIIELPIHFEDRRIGQSKMSTRVKFESAWRVWELLWRHRSRLAPMKTTGRNDPLAVQLERPADQPSEVPTDAPT